ncbi:Family of serine hydrolases 2 [Nakaseomyces bracarensis]|uniref:Family of serine hydrolases 2 n=1 Tax=Nakaseomyces bracarensis TaxID=273131 RepID=A0ABR4NM13_9SACH
MSKKVLMLHGLAQSGDYFESKTKGFKQELEKLGYELYYPTAPNRYPPADLPAGLLDEISDGMTSSDGVIAWLQNDEQGGGYSIPDTTITFLHDYIISHGPFHGLVGFSQGAGVAGYLATDINGLLGLTAEEQPQLEFMMVFSGFRFRPPKYQAQYDSHPIKIRSLHVQGELDTVTEPERVQSLFTSCDSETRTFLSHKGGHFIPNSRGFLKKIVEWLN